MSINSFAGVAGPLFLLVPIKTKHRLLYFLVLL
jgi:hypothetical protein